MASTDSTHSSEPIMNRVRVIWLYFLCCALKVVDGGLALFEYHDFSNDFSSQTQEPKLEETVVLHCEAYGSQVVTGWTRNGVSILDSPLSFSTNGSNLTIPAFSKEYDALYQCIAMKLHGVDVRPQLSPPILVSAFENRYFVQQPQVFVGYIVRLSSTENGYEPIAFQCELLKIYNGVKPIITWQIIETAGNGPILNITDTDVANERYILQYDHIGYIQIHSPTDAMDGLQARCVATRPDSQSESVYSDWSYANLTGVNFPDMLDLQPGFDPFSQRPPVVYHVEEGQEIAILPCTKLNGLHSHPLVWSEENPQVLVLLTEPSVISLLTGVSGFGYTNVQVDVSNGNFLGMHFVCRIQRSDESEAEAPSVIAGPAPPLPPPTVINSSFTIDVITGDSFVLNYTIQTNDQVNSVWWWKNGVLISNADPRYKLAVDGIYTTLSISSYNTVTDAGLYQVLVLSGSTRYMFFGEIGNYFLNDPSTATYIISSSGDVIVDIGSSVTHSVTAGGIPDTITYQWRKDDIVIPGETSNTLTINNAGFDDIGLYECIPSNALGTFNTSNMQLDIKVTTTPINALAILDGIVIRQNIVPSISEGTYSCSDALPNGVELTQSGQLVVRNVLSASDRGQYRCTTSRITGFIVIDLDIYVPAFVISSTEDITTLIGSTVRLVIMATGFPEPLSYIWKRNCMVIAGATTNTLNISGVSIEDIGKYECIPSNTGGNTYNTSTIQLAINGPIPHQLNITLHIIGNNLLQVTWTPPSFTSQCTAVSRYSITSNATNSIITTTDTSVDIPLAGLPPGVYCVSVATVDTANRTGEYSNEECIVILSVPPCANITCEYFNHSEESSLVIYQLHWEFTPSPIPPLQWVYIYNNVTGNTIRVSGNLESDQITIMRGQHYMFSVFGENVIGNGTTCDSSEVIAFLDVKELFTTSSTTATCTTSSYTTTTAAECTTTCLSSVSAGISVGITVPVTAVITAIITVIILYLYQRRVNKQSSNKATPPQDYEIPISTNEVEMKGNTAYGQVQYTTDTVNKPTLYEELHM